MLNMMQLPAQYVSCTSTPVSEHADASNEYIAFKSALLFNFNCASKGMVVLHKPITVYNGE